MDFDWKTLAGDLVKVGAPMIGTALGGPLGTVVGGLAGTALSEALGVPNTPTDIANAIAPATIAGADPTVVAEIAARLQVADENFSTAMANATIEETKQIGASERAELTGGDRFQRWWRPLNGYITSYLVAVFGTEIAIAIGQALVTGNQANMNAVFAGVTSTVFFLSVPASISGVSSIGRSFEKVKGLVSGGYGGFVAGAVKLIAKK